MVEFCNMAILEHQIEALVAVGVKKVVLAVSYKPEDMTPFIAEMEKKYGITVVCSLEVEPMGTGRCHDRLFVSLLELPLTFPTTPSHFIV